MACNIIVFMYTQVNCEVTDSHGARFIITPVSRFVWTKMHGDRHDVLSQRGRQQQRACNPQRSWEPFQSKFPFYLTVSGWAQIATSRFSIYLQICGWKPHVACGSPTELESPLQCSESNGKLLNLTIACKQLQVIAASFTTCNILFNLKDSCISFLWRCKQQHLMLAIYRMLQPTKSIVVYLWFSCYTFVQ